MGVSRPSPVRSLGAPGGAARWMAATALVLLASGAWTAPAAARQQDTVPGVDLGIVYQEVARPVLEVRPFSGAPDLAARVRDILVRDLRFSNRFEVRDPEPGAASTPGPSPGEEGVVWVVEGEVQPGEGGSLLALQLHDVVFRGVKGNDRFPLPDPGNRDFRMSVHRAADELVRWATGARGIAATRVAFSREAGGATELWVVDSDGENLRRLTDHGGIVLSPAWFRDGTRIAFSYQDLSTGATRIRELNLLSGREWIMEPGIPGQHLTPAYSPDGSTLAFSVLGERRGIYTWDLERDCCLGTVASGRWDDVTPAWSPDGRRIAFNTNRLGVGTPQIMVAPAGGGEADLVSPYRFGEGGHYTSPDWSPVGDRLAFHGRIGRGRYQVLVADLEARGSRVAQLTFEGNNEDPSWAPDGRHLVFVGERAEGVGLWVVDTVTGDTRPLLLGMRPKVPRWSPWLTR